jgi:hypothetical protein
MGTVGVKPYGQQITLLPLGPAEDVPVGIGPGQETPAFIAHGVYLQ